MSLMLNWTTSGPNGRGTLVALLDDAPVHIESLNLARSKARTEFVDAVCNDRPDIDRKTVEGELLKLAAAEVADKPEQLPDPATLPEIDASRIVRPERFIAPEVSGLTVPSMVAFGDSVTGRWQLYLRWKDGRRERRVLGPTLDLPDGGRLFVHPIPTAPPPTAKAGWSAEARRRWLEGEPAPSPAEVFKRLCERVAYFLDLPEDEAAGVTASLACWVLLSYVYQAWDAIPYLYVGGPLGSGKSRVFEIFSRLVFRPLTSSSLTGAALFRTLHMSGGALLLDEAERLKRTQDPDVGDILAMLLAGYKRGGSATRLEPTGDGNFRPMTFDVFGPKALACIAGLPPALASRCVPVTMFRAPPGSEKPRRRIDGDPAGWQSLRDNLHALALEHGATFLGLANRSDVVPSMLGRDYELWQPLLSIASWVEREGSEGLLELMQGHALATIDAGRDDQTPDHDETLLKLLARAVRFGERPTPGELLDQAKEVDLEGFRRLSARAVAEHLKRYGLTTNKTAGRKCYGQVTLADLGRIETNYGIDLGIKDG